MPFVVGESIGPYRILEQLGQGGMATVFKAYHAALDRYVAIKALHPAFMEDPNFHARFQREAQVVAKLEHPNIVPIYDFAEYESRPYLVMKYIEGETLKARLADATLDQIELIQIVKAVGAGLTYAHQKGILHRDVKPSNVLLGHDGCVYLADFGLARIAQAGESTLSSDMMLGTPQYISPEQAMGLGELDERTDIYSFGVMLYEMIVGQVPFSADTPFSIIHDHIYTPLPLPRSVNPEVSESVERVLLKALAKERVDRYPDATTLAEAFERAILVEPGKGPVDSHLTPDATQIAEPYPASDTITVPDTGQVQEFQPAAPEMTAPLGILDGPDDVSVLRVKSRRRFRWWYILMGILLIIACCICSLVGYGVFVGFPDRVEPSSEQFQEDPILEPISEFGPQSDVWVDEIPLPEAQAKIEDDPQNPYAWLELSEAYSQAGHTEEARSALDRALEIAGDDPDFYYYAAEELGARAIWVEAAHVYLDGILRFSPDGVPEDIKNGLSEAVYWGAEYPNAGEDIPIPRIADVDLPLAQVAKARYEFYQGDPGEAERILEEVLMEINPGMPEAILLQAEMFSTWGDPGTAMDILFEMTGRDDIPDWIQEYIEFLAEDSLIQLDEAQRLVEENPNDPWLQLDLYAAYLALGMRDEAQGALEHALQLGDGDPEVLIFAGDISAAYGNWLQAAQLYSHSVRKTQSGAPTEVTEKFMQALFYGATEEGAPEVIASLESPLPENDQGALPPIIRDTLIARYKLYFEGAGEAEIIINDVLRRSPNLPMARMVQAEVYLILGDLDQSQEILLDLETQQGLFPWMHEEIGFMLSYINPDL